MPSYLQGRFSPQYPNKYIGNTNNIVFRSSWERIFMKWADNNSNVVSWGSEEMFVQYYSPVDNKLHRYFPDFVMTIKDKSGKHQTWMVEIKPFAQTQHPSTKNYRSKRTQIKEVMEYGKNQAKWAAATNYCANKNWRFVVLTEQNLGIK